MDAGNYTVQEGTQLSWLLTGIGGSSDPNTPYNCTTAGANGSSGTGILNTRTASISLKNGDTVTCVFENTGNGATRTQGFWATHPQLAELAWNGGTAFGHTFPGVATVLGDKALCGNVLTINAQPGAAAANSELMGGFWADISKLTTGKKRTALGQAKMQLLQQLLAAELNASAFGSSPSSGSFAAWETAFCGTNTTAIKNAQQQAASFNSQGDSQKFTPGTSADSKFARYIAKPKFWDSAAAGTLSAGAGADVPATTLSIGEPKLNRRAGTAKLPVTVPGPGELALAGDGLVAQRASSAGSSKLLIKARGHAKRTLERTGRVAVKAKITYTPGDGAPLATNKEIRLKRKLR